MVPQAECADWRTNLLHGGEQAVSGGIRQAGLLRQIGQRHVAELPKYVPAASRPRVNDCADRSPHWRPGLLRGFLPRLAIILFPYDGIHFRFCR